MQRFLDQYIKTLRSPQTESIYGILNAVKRNKNDLDGLVRSISTSLDNTEFVVAQETFGGGISIDKVQDAHNNLMLSLRDLFSRSQNISDSLSIYTEILLSEIKAAEKEIDAMSKAAYSYAFTLGDGGAYDESHVETFSDDLSRYLFEEQMMCDRSNRPFSESELARVNPEASILTLSPRLQSSHALFGEILSNNYSEYLSSDTGLHHIFEKTNSTGWRVSVSAPKPMVKNVGDRSIRGSEARLIISNKVDQPSDSIIITPYPNLPVTINQLTLFSDDRSQIVDLIDEPIRLDRIKTFGFPSFNVRYVEMVISQPLYSRSYTVSDQSEELHRKLFEEVRVENPDTFNYYSYPYNPEAFSRVISRTYERIGRKVNPKASPKVNFKSDGTPKTILDYMMGRQTDEGFNWRDRMPLGNTVSRMIQETIFSVYPQFFHGKISNLPDQIFFSRISDFTNNYSNQIDEANANLGTSVNLDLYEPQALGSYEYKLGLSKFELGLSHKIFRGNFISQPVPLHTDAGEVRMLVEDFNPVSNNNQLDNPILTSIEYSVTNKANPSKEEDWIPIQPSNYGELVQSERLFFNASGLARFRFPASSYGSLLIFNNGKLYDPNLYTRVLADSQDYVVGIRIPSSRVSDLDIWTVSYITYKDRTVINFVDQGFGRSLLASASDSKGPGETFEGGAHLSKIRLTKTPYVDRSRFDNTSGYSSVYGFTGNYQPVTIILSDGSAAQNHTNYLGVLQNNLTMLPTEQVSFIQSGPYIVFNRPVNERFTVYYQYMPSNFKYRVIMRVNSPDYVDPEVDLVRIKFKTYKSDSGRDF